MIKLLNYKFTILHTAERNFYEYWMIESKKMISQETYNLIGSRE